MAPTRLICLVAAGLAAPLNVFADAGFGPHFTAGLAFGWFIVLSVPCLAACSFWPGPSREHRVALGLGAPALGIVAGIAAFSAPGPDDVQLTLFVVASIVPVIVAIVYVLAQRAKANYAGRK